MNRNARDKLQFDKGIDQLKLIILMCRQSNINDNT